ncbi:MAG: DUF6715 family protein [Butyrivibrio sp.]
MKQIWNKMRKPIIFTLMAVVVVGVYYYCSRKEVDNNNKISANDEITEIISRDLNLNYPSTPKSVVTFYSKIIEAVYKTQHTDEELAALAGQARGLFDEELLLLNDYDTYMENLKIETEVYQKAGRYISGFEVDDGYNIKYLKFEGRSYAKINVKYYVREGKNLIYTYEKYTLREDEEGNWKILYWELTDASSMED